MGVYPTILPNVDKIIRMNRISSRSPAESPSSSSSWLPSDPRDDDDDDRNRRQQRGTEPRTSTWRGKILVVYFRICFDNEGNTRVLYVDRQCQSGETSGIEFSLKVSKPNNVRI